LNMNININVTDIARLQRNADRMLGSINSKLFANTKLYKYMEGADSSEKETKMRQFSSEFKLCIPRKIWDENLNEVDSSPHFVGICVECLDGYDRNDPFRSPGITGVEREHGWLRCSRCSESTQMHWWLSTVMVKIAASGVVNFADYFQMMDCLVIKSITNGDVVGYDDYDKYLNSFCVGGRFDPEFEIDEVVDQIVPEEGRFDVIEIKEEYGRSSVQTCLGVGDRGGESECNYQSVDVSNDPLLYGTVTGMVAVYPCIPVSGGMTTVMLRVLNIVKDNELVLSYDGFNSYYKLGLIGNSKIGDIIDITYYYKSSTGSLYEIENEKCTVGFSNMCVAKGFSMYKNSSDITYFDKAIYNDYCLGNYGLIIVKFEHLKRFTFSVEQKVRFYVSNSEKSVRIPMDSVGITDNYMSVVERLNGLYLRTCAFVCTGRTNKLVGDVGNEQCSWMKDYRWKWFYKEYNKLREDRVKIGGKVTSSIVRIMRDYMCTLCSRVRSVTEFRDLNCGACICHTSIDYVKSVVALYQIIVDYTSILSSQSEVIVNLSFVLPKFNLMLRNNLLDYRKDNSNHGCLFEYVDLETDMEFFCAYGS